MQKGSKTHFTKVSKTEVEVLTKFGHTALNQVNTFFQKNFIFKN